MQLFVVNGDDECESIQFALYCSLCDCVVGRHTSVRSSGQLTQIIIYFGSTLYIEYRPNKMDGINAGNVQTNIKSIQSILLDIFFISASFWQRKTNEQQPEHPTATNVLSIVVDDADETRLHWRNVISLVHRWIEFAPFWNGLGVIYANRCLDVRYTMTSHPYEIKRTREWQKKHSHSIDGIIVSYRIVHHIQLYTLTHTDLLDACRHRRRNINRLIVVWRVRCADHRHCSWAR